MSIVTLAATLTVVTVFHLSMGAVLGLSLGFFS